MQSHASVAHWAKAQDPALKELKPVTTAKFGHYFGGLAESVTKHIHPKYAPNGSARNSLVMVG